MSVKPPQYQTPEFVALQRQWYDRLESAGFRDLENLDGRGDLDGPLNQSQYDIRIAYTMEKERYFQLAGQWVHHRTITGWYKPRDKVRWGARYQKVWELHAEGVPASEIAKMFDVHEKTVLRWLADERALLLRHDKETTEDY